MMTRFLRRLHQPSMPSKILIRQRRIGGPGIPRKARDFHGSIDNFMNTIRDILDVVSSPGALSIFCPKRSTRNSPNDSGTYILSWGVPGTRTNPP